VRCGLVYNANVILPLDYSRFGAVLLVVGFVAPDATIP